MRAGRGRPQFAGRWPSSGVNCGCSLGWAAGRNYNGWCVYGIQGMAGKDRHAGILASIADRASIRSFSVGDWAGLNGLGGEAEELATRAYAPELPWTAPIELRPKHPS